MVIDIIKYKLADGITEEFLRESAEDILSLWMSKQEGFVKWQINKTDKGYVDFVFWETKEALDSATVKMKDIPADHNWLKCYDMTSVSAEKASNLFTF